MRQFGLLALLLPAAANATSWTIDSSSSHIDFTFAQMGSSVAGHFAEIKGDITFDPAALDRALVTAEIAINSVDTGNKERDAGVTSTSWFDLATFPVASFVSSSFDATGGDSYEVSGDLTIRGVTQEIVLPMSIKIHGDHARAEGGVTLDRRDFELGQGDWASDKVIGYEVPLHIVIEAKQAP